MTPARAPRARAAAAPATRILVVDDSPDTLELIQRNLASEGWEVTTAERADDALAHLASAPVDLVITDIRMPGRSGYELIHDVRELHPGVEIIVITGYATVEGAVRALQAGAWNYLAKPFTDEELFHAVREGLRRRANEPGGHAGEALSDVHGLLGRSSAMRALFEALHAAAPSGGTVLLRGEQGSGRELAARALHALSGRPGTFQRLSLAAARGAPAESTATALESAERAAAGGTVYLAAVDAAGEEARHAVTERLARAHGRRAHESARFVLSAVAGADELARLGRDGAALTGALAHVVAVPPLRDRGDDVVLLARHFLAHTAGEARIKVRVIGEAAAQALLAWAWPGNVSELRDLCVLLALSDRTGPIAVGELPGPIAGALGGGAPADPSLDAAERAHIAQVLRRTGGNKSRAAELLGIDRKTLREKLRGGSPGGEHDAD
jgi:DNA-binding NtrC family response regulator